MTDRAVNWLFYTCLLALIPIICRIAVWLIIKDGVSPFATIDFIVFGIILHSANINEVNRIGGADRAWRTAHNGTSTIFLILYSLLIFAAIFDDASIDTNMVLMMSIVMGAVTLFLAVSVIKRAGALEPELQ